MLMLLSLAALAAEPEVAATWRRGALEVEILAPAGEHVAPDAPVSLALDLGGGRSTSVQALGASTLVTGLPGGAPWALEGELSLSLCTDDGSACRPLTREVRGALVRPRGRTSLALSRPRPEAPLLLRAPAPEASFAAALEAASDGRPVLVDFSARWCPPCNVLAAEVLDDPEATSGVHLVVVDADLPASWPLKDRYEVGAYPTVVLVDASGEELGRLVGYPGREATLDWLHEAGGRAPVAERLAGLGTLTPEERGALAVDLVRAGAEAQARLALEGAEGEGARLAAVALDGTPEDIRWAATHAPARLAEHLWPHLEAVRADPALRADVLAALAPLAADPEHGADVLELCADLSEGTERALYYAAVAGLVRAQLTGEPAADRGRWSGLAWALEEAGDARAAEDVLLGALDAYPEEFTYHYALAGLQLRAERWAEAETRARAALERSQGDMGLRAAMRLATILRSAGRTDAASALLEEALADFEAPESGVEVRTHRYLSQTRELLDELRSDR